MVFKMSPLFSPPFPPNWPTDPLAQKTKSTQTSLVIALIFNYFTAYFTGQLTNHKKTFTKSCSKPALNKSKALCHFKQVCNIFFLEFSIHHSTLWTVEWKVSPCYYDSVVMMLIPVFHSPSFYTWMTKYLLQDHLFKSIEVARMPG